MKSHQLAKALSQLAAALRSLPDVDLEVLLSNIRGLDTQRAKTGNIDSDSVALNVATLAALSRIDKSKWKELITEWQLPIEVPRKDSARNIMGEVMRYLDSHPEEIGRLQQVTSKRSKASPALMKALSILLDSANSEKSGP